MLDVGEGRVSNLRFARGSLLCIGSGLLRWRMLSPGNRE